MQEFELVEADQAQRADDLSAARPEEPEPSAAPVAQAEPPALENASKSPPSKVVAAPKPDKAVKTSPPKPKPRDAANEDDLLAEAFGRLEAGETIGVVADDIGMTMYKLRSRWAARCKKKRAEAAPDTATTPEEQEDCRLCGHSFHPTMASDGLCARCSRI